MRSTLLRTPTLVTQYKSIGADSTTGPLQNYHSNCLLKSISCNVYFSYTQLECVGKAQSDGRPADEWID